MLPKPDIGSVAAFKQTLLNARAVAYSGEGRAGVVVAEIFSRLGIADQMKVKSILFAGSGGPKTIIDGQADLVIQTFGGLIGVPGLDYVGALPHDLQMYTVLTGGIASSSSQPQAAKAFIDFPITRSNGCDNVERNEGKQMNDTADRAIDRQTSEGSGGSQSPANDRPVLMARFTAARSCIRHPHAM